ncbi:hypothetical protein [Sphaerisporangium perillae]|uniref:hypothetical protein n=1 Tax=Sphaerisporangium perillae TaxID=2935860 RepID=UPI00200DF55E|nr:hypothetical protein [Sphaerisporangium perillae]
MYRDQRRRELRQVLGALAACGAMVGLVAGCGGGQPGEKLLGSSSFQAGDAATATCPSVAERLPDIPTQAISGVARNLGLMEIQVAAANQRLAARTDAADPGTAQTAVLGTLENQRAVLIQEIVTILGRGGEKPEGLDALAACTFGGAAALAAPAPMDTAIPTDLAPTDGALPTDGAAPTDGTAPSDGAVPTDGAAPTDGAVPTDGGVPSDSAFSAFPTDAAEPAETAAPTGKASPTGKAATGTKATKTPKPTKSAKPKGPVEILVTPEPSAPAKTPTQDPSAAPSDTAAASDAASPADSATGTAAPAGTADPAGTAAPADGGAAAATGTGLAVDCPPAAEALVGVPGVIKAEVARNLGLLELQVASVNRQLLASADQEDAEAVQQSLLRALQQKRELVIERIAARVYRATGTPPDLDAFVECTLGGGGSSPSDSAAPFDSAAPADTSGAAPTDPAPADTAAPEGKPASDGAPSSDPAARDLSSSGGY